MSRRQLLRGAGSLVLLLQAPQLLSAAPNAASIVAVRVWPAEDYTRVTLESDRPLAVKHFMVDKPDRLVIDIEGLELSPGLRELIKKVRPDDPYIASVRVGQNQPTVVRIVLDLKQPAAPQIFTLKPFAPYQHRLVFDLHPAEEPDPLLALVREKEQAEAKAAAAVNDALDELLRKIERPPELPRKPEPAASVLRPAPPPPASAMTPVPSPAASAPLPSQRQLDRLIVIAVDPGHGGEDPGAVGPSGLKEKDVVLAVALKLRERLHANRNIRVMLTRDGDYFVPLQERVRKARRVQADLFVSIHADAFFTPQARGASVFALSDGAASSNAARWMADKENASDLVGGISNIKVKDAVVLKTLLDMSTAAQIKDSLRLGSEVLGQIGQVGRLHKKQVEQAGFVVLKAPDIPSILVETAFISNPEEESKLRDPAYQQKLVEAVATGIARYFAKNPPLTRHRALS